jgi:16S rRNA processing protein RimM
MDAGKSYLVKDLVGCQVVTTDGEVLGPLTDVLPTGGNDVFVVGEGRDEILIPALKSVVLEINLETRRIKVDLMKGLREQPGMTKKGDEPKAGPQN